MPNADCNFNAKELTARSPVALEVAAQFHP